MNWRHVGEGEFPLQNELVWVAGNQEGRKGMVISVERTNPFDSVWNDENGAPMEVSRWVPIEDSPNQPPELDYYVLGVSKKVPLGNKRLIESPVDEL